MTKRVKPIEIIKPIMPIPRLNATAAISWTILTPMPGGASLQMTMKTRTTPIMPTKETAAEKNDPKSGRSMSWRRGWWKARPPKITYPAMPIAKAHPPPLRAVALWLWCHLSTISQDAVGKSTSGGVGGDGNVLNSSFDGEGTAGAGDEKQDQCLSALGWSPIFATSPITPCPLEDHIPGFLNGLLRRSCPITFQSC